MSETTAWPARGQTACRRHSRYSRYSLDSDRMRALIRPLLFDFFLTLSSGMKMSASGRFGGWLRGGWEWVRLSRYVGLSSSAWPEQVFKLACALFQVAFWVVLDDSPGPSEACKVRSCPIQASMEALQCIEVGCP